MGQQVDTKVGLTKEPKCVTALEWPGMAAVARRSGRLVLLATRSSPGRHYRCPSARTVKLFVWGLSLIFCMPYFVLDLLTLFHICYSNSGENLGKSSLRLFVLSKLGSKNCREFFSAVMILSTRYPNAKWWIHPPQNTTLLNVLGRYIGDQDWISLQQVVILTQRWWQSH